jgi:hypothetical protein
MARVNIQRIVFLLASSAVAALMGCEQPAEVELRPVEVDGGVVVSSIAEADTGLVIAPVDSSGMLPIDRYRFEASMQVTRVVYDAGAKSVDSFAVSRAYFSDRGRPVLFGGRVLAYFGLDLGVINLNGSPMLKRFYRIPIPRVGRDTIAGVEYISNLTQEYKPNTVYEWSLSGIVGQGFRPSIQSPDDLRVLSPVGGSIVPKGRDLLLRWTGKGNVWIVISAYDPVTKSSKPLLHIVPTDAGRNRAVLSSQTLRLLPANRFYWFTFTFYNRLERGGMGQYPGKILIQAASVYNSLVELR